VRDTVMPVRSVLVSSDPRGEELETLLFLARPPFPIASNHGP
jgi:hypothetical protein